MKGNMRLSLAGIVGESIAENTHDGSLRGHLGLLWTNPMKALLGLQVCDIVTTLTFRSMGLAETNPLVDGLMEQFGTLGGLLIVKAAAIAIALAVGIASRPVFVRRINWVYCVIVSLNLLTIAQALYAR